MIIQIAVFIVIPKPFSDEGFTVLNHQQAVCVPIILRWQWVQHLSVATLLPAYLRQEHGRLLMILGILSAETPRQFRLLDGLQLPDID